MIVQAQIGKSMRVGNLLNLLDKVKIFINQAFQLSETQQSLILGHSINIKRQLYNIIDLELNVRMSMVQKISGFTAVYLK